VRAVSLVECSHLLLECPIVCAQGGGDGAGAG